MKTIILSHQAVKDLAALPIEARASIKDALHDYAIRGVGDTKRLRGSEFLRLRVGRYRVIFAEDRVTILTVYIGKRETTTYGRGRM